MKRSGLGWYCLACATVYAQHEHHPPEKATQKMDQHHAAGHGEGVASGGHMGRHFDDAARWAKEFDNPARAEWQMPDRVISTLGLKSGQLVADIGAGTGYFAVRLAKSAAKPMVYAVDVESAMVEHLRQRAVREGLRNLTVVQGEAGSPRLPQPVDLALLVNTYHHLADRPAYLARLAAALKPGGRLAIVDWKKGAPLGPPDSFRFTEQELIGELKHAGFVVDARHDFLPHQMFIIVRKR